MILQEIEYMIGISLKSLDNIDGINADRHLPEEVHSKLSAILSAENNLGINILKNEVRQDLDRAVDQIIGWYE